jgi:hypothetical protein
MARKVNKEAVSERLSSSQRLAVRGKRSDRCGLSLELASV